MDQSIGQLGNMSESVVEMTLVMYMSANRLRDKIRNELIQKKLEVVLSEEKMRESRLTSATKAGDCIS